MKKILIFFSLLFLFTNVSFGNECQTIIKDNKTYVKCYDKYRWTKQDYILESVFVASAITRWTQTLQLSRNVMNDNPQSTDYVEKKDVKRTINLYFSTYIISHIAISNWLSNPYRNIFQSVFIIVELDAIHQNRKAGLGVNFNF